MIMLGAALYNRQIQLQQLYVKQSKNQLTLSGDAAFPTQGRHVMAGCLKFTLGSAPDACIEQDIHAADSILRGSIRS